jgi:DNA-binding transcriptional regulator YiaG
MTFDPDFGKTGFPRRLFRLRFRRLRLTQEGFADRYGLSLGSVKDAEQGRHAPLPAFRLAIAAIEMDPAMMARAAQSATQDD